MTAHASARRRPIQTFTDRAGPRRAGAQLGDLERDLLGELAVGGTTLWHTGSARYQSRMRSNSRSVKV
jgi:hypothetical protein